MTTLVANQELVELMLILMDVMSAQMDMTILVTTSNVISVKNLNAVNQPNQLKLADLKTLTAVLV
jgi:hypothetical protein